MSFVVVEFTGKKKHCSVVPLIWLTKNNTKCWWPTKTSNDVFETLVSSCTQPAYHWKMFDIKKVFCIVDSYEEAQVQLNLILSESSHSESPLDQEHTQKINSQGYNSNYATDADEVITIVNAEESATENDSYRQADEEDPLKENSPETQESFDGNGDHAAFQHQEERPCFRNKKGKEDSVNSKRAHYLNTESSNEETRDVDRKSVEAPLKQVKNKCKKSKIYNEISGRQSERNLTPKNIKTVHVAGPNGSTPSSRFHGDANASTSSSGIRADANGFTPRINFSQPNSREGTPARTPTFGTTDSLILSRIIKKLESLEKMAQQSNTKIDQIFCIVSDNTVGNLNKPEDFSKVPIESKRSFKLLEIQLQNIENFTYLKNRLAVIGGGTVRAVTINMMRYLLTNKLATKFNWVGHHNKKPFKDTNLMKVIREAVFLHFRAGQNAEPIIDLNDTIIVKAIQDWLRLAPQRQRYSDTQRQINNNN